MEDGRPGLVPGLAAPPGSPGATARPAPVPRGTSLPGRAEGGSVRSALEGVRHPLARFLLRLPATPCLPPYCFPVVLAPVKAHSGFHKTEQRKVLKCREALGNTLACLPPSTPKISASPPAFSSYEHPLSITRSHNSSTKHNQLFPTKYGFKMVPCSCPESRRESLGSFRAGFAADPLPCCCRCCAERGGRAGAFLLPLPRNLCCRTHDAC